MSQARLKATFISIGGEEKVRTIVREFYKKMSQDVLIGFFFADKDIRTIADKQSDFLLFAVGIHPVFHGKLPTVAHLELPPILKGHFDRRLVLLRLTLEEQGVAEEDILTWIEFESAFRNVVQN